MRGATIIGMFLSLLASTWLAVASASAQSAQSAPPDAKPASEKESPIPDAMQHLLKAPDIDIAKLRDPFESYLATVSSRPRASLLEQQRRLGNREREVLESFDLSTLKLVAIFKKGEDRVALIEDSTGKGYIVRPGNYMGKDNGRIEKIDDDTIYLVEQVLNPAGEITERQVTLTLKEVNE